MLVRELFARLGLQVDSSGFDVADSLFSRAKGGLVAVGAAASAMATALAGAIGTAAARAGEMSDLAERTGVAAEALQALDYSAKLAGVEVGELAQSFGFLSRTAAAAAAGSGEAQRAFAKAGLAIRDSSGALKSADTLLLEVADTFQGMPAGVEKTALAMQLFGRSGAGMLPFLNQGSAAIAALQRESRELGAVMDERTIAAGDRLGDNFGRLTEALKGLRNLIVGPLFEPLANFVEGLVQWMRVNNRLIAAKVTPWLKGLGKVLGYVAELAGWAATTFGKWAVALGVFFAAWKLGTLLHASTALTSMLSTLRALTIAQLRAAASAALIPLIWIALAAAVVLAADEVATFFRGGETLLGKFGEKWTKWLDDFLKEDNDDWWVTRKLKAALRALTDLQAAFGLDDAGKAARAADARRLQATYNSVSDTGFAGWWKRNVMVEPLTPAEANGVFGGGASPAASVAAGARARTTVGSTTIVVGDIHVQGTESPSETAALTLERLQTELRTAKEAVKK